LTVIGEIGREQCADSIGFVSHLSLLLREELPMRLGLIGMEKSR
jgi:hypothetical protein